MLTQLVNDILAEKIDVVVVWRSDRIVRDSGVCDSLMKLFRAKGTRFICGNRDMDITSATGLYQAMVEAANNRRYRDQTSEDIMRDHDFKAALGMFSRNPSCLGYRSKGKGSQAVEVIPEEIELVNRIFRLFVQGEGEEGPLGINAICRKLMDEGTKLARGAKGHIPKHENKVHTSQIRTILSNCMYIGRWRHRGKEYECDLVLVPSSDGTDKWQTAVPVALYEAAQEKLRLSDRPGKRSLTSEHLLTGLMVCARCGRPLQVNYRQYKDKDGNETRPPRRTYLCTNSRPPGYCKKWGMKLVQEPVLDEWVIQELAPLLEAEIREMRTASGRDADVQTLAELERKLKEAREKEGPALAECIRTMDKEQIEMVAKHLRGEREHLQRRAEEIRARFAMQETVAPDLSAADLAGMPKGAVKDALRRAIQWIAVGSEGVTVLTSWGTYIGATFQEIPKRTYFRPDTRRGINPPSPAACLRCPTWLPSPEDFIKGRRDSMGKRAVVLSDNKILPDPAQTNGEPVQDVELSIEVIDL